MQTRDFDGVVGLHSCPKCGRPWSKWERLYSEAVDVASELFQYGGRYSYLLTVGDSCTTDGVRALAAECDRLKEQLAEKDARIAELEALIIDLRAIVESDPLCKEHPEAFSDTRRRARRLLEETEPKP